MTIPTLGKTWQIKHVTSSAGSSVLQSSQNLLYAIKNALCTFSASPWTVVSSSNGSASANSDLWTSASAISWGAGSGSPHAWIVLQQSALALSGKVFQLLIDTTSATNPAVSLTFKWTWSDATGFTGGTHIISPTGNSDVVTMGQFGWSGHSSTPSSPFSGKAHIWLSSDGECTRVVVYNSDVATAPGSFWLIDKVAYPITESSGSPLWPRVVSIFDAWDGSNLPMKGTILSTGSPSPGVKIRTRITNVTSPNMYLGSEGFFANVAGHWLNSNALDSSANLAPISVYDKQLAATSNRLGGLYDLWFVNENYTDGNTFPSNGTRQFVVISDMALPWDGIALDAYGTVSDASFAAHATGYTYPLPTTVPDTTAPTIGSFSPANGSTITNSTAGTFQVTDAGGLGRVTVLAIYGDGTTDVVHDGSSFQTPFASTSTRSTVANGYSFSVRPSSGWSNASVTIRIIAVDTSGNERSSDYALSVSNPVLPDTTAPAVDTFSPSDGSTITNSTAATFHVTDTGGLRRVSVLCIYGDGTTDVIHDGSNFLAPFSSLSTRTAITGGYSYSVAPATGWTNSSITLRIIAVDTSGNETLSNYALTVSDPVLFDTTSPTVTNFSPASGSIVTAAGNGSFDVTDVGGFKRVVVVAVYTDGTAAVVHDGSDFLGGFSGTSSRTAVSDGYHYTISCDSGWPSSTVTLRIIAIDDSGNETVSNYALTVSNPVLPDTTTPTVTAFSPSSGSTITHSDTGSFEVTDEGGLQRVLVMALYGDGTAAVVHDGSSFQANFTGTSSRSAISSGFQYTIGHDTGWPNASVTIRVIATDESGNEAVADYELEVSDPILPDTTAPSIGGFSPASGSTVASTDSCEFTVTDSGGLDEVLVWAVYGDGSSDLVYDGTAFLAPFTGSTAVAVASGFAYQIAHGTGWPSASVTLRIVASDISGNRSSAEYAVSVLDPALPDTTGPEIANFTPVTGSTSSNATTVQFDITDDESGVAEYIITAFYGLPGQDQTEVVYLNGFQAPFESSTSTSITNGVRVLVQRSSEWLGDSFGLNIHARDGAGNTSTVSYTLTSDSPVYPASAPDSIAPTVSNMTPNPNSTISRMQPIEFDVTDNSGLFRRVMIVATYPTGASEVVHDGQDFRSFYQLHSTRTMISGGFHYRVLRDSGWHANPTLTPYAIDQAGNEAA